VRTNVSAAQAPVPYGTVLHALVAFAAVLRKTGVPVSMVEMLDASRAVALVNVSDRHQLHRALALTMVKRSEELPVFDAVFDLCFAAAAVDEPDGAGSERSAQAGDLPDETNNGPEDLLDELVGALRAGSDTRFGPLAEQVVSVFGGLEAAQALRGERYYVHRALRQVDLSTLLRRAMMADEDDVGDRHLRQLAAARRQARLEQWVASLAAEVQRRLVAQEGLGPALDRLARSALDIEFLRAGASDLEQMRKLVRPLARQMATRARHRRRLATSGRLDVRRTMRLALGTGGVAINPVWRRPLARRPELVVMCDVSGSVAEFAKFTLSLLQALHQELPGSRSFVFVDAPAEVSDLVRHSPGVIDPRLFLSRPGAIADGGHSDYGAVLQRLINDHFGSLGPRTTMIFCGDGRTNGHPSRSELLRALRRRVRRLYWLNPEPRQSWGTGDSAVAEYRPHCDEMAEVRNLRQLSYWVQTMLVN
jgi:uncharacterized protein with von Willebrand factor type A (vWA) domain